MSIDDSPAPALGGPGRPAPAGTPAKVADAVDALAAAVAALTALEPSDVDGPQAAWVTAAIAEATSRLGVTSARMLPVIEADGLWATGGARSFPLWVARTHQVSVRTARDQVKLGRALRDDLPATAAAGAAGQVTLEQAQVLARLAPTTELRRQVLADAGDECNEAFLVEQAKTRGCDDFRILVRRWAAAADPDADDRGYVEAADREHLELSKMPDGYHLRGQLTLEHGQALLAALDAATPVPAADDQRTPTQRRAQALADLARILLDRGLVGTGRTVRPRIHVLVDHATLLDLVAAATAAGERTGQGSLPGFTAPALLGMDPGTTTGPQYED